MQRRDEAEREQEQKKSEWEKDSGSKECTHIHTDPTLKKLEEQNEMILDRGAAVAEREMTNSTEVKASVGQSFSSPRGRSHMHLCLPGADRSTTYCGKADVFCCEDEGFFFSFFLLFYLYELISLLDSLFQFFLFMLQDRTCVLLSFEFLKPQGEHFSYNQSKT